MPRLAPLVYRTRYDVAPSGLFRPIPKTLNTKRHRISTGISWEFAYTPPMVRLAWLASASDRGSPDGFVGWGDRQDRRDRRDHPAVVRRSHRLAHETLGRPDPRGHRAAARASRCPARTASDRRDHQAAAHPIRCPVWAASDYLDHQSHHVHQARRVRQGVAHPSHCHVRVASHHLANPEEVGVHGLSVHGLRGAGSEVVAHPRGEHQPVARLTRSQPAESCLEWRPASWQSDWPCHGTRRGTGRRSPRRRSRSAVRPRRATGRRSADFGDSTTRRAGQCRRGEPRRADSPGIGPDRRPSRRRSGNARSGRERWP